MSIRTKFIIVARHSIGIYIYIYIYDENNNATVNFNDKKESHKRVFKGKRRSF